MHIIRFFFFARKTKAGCKRLWTRSCVGTWSPAVDAVDDHGRLSDAVTRRVRSRGSLSGPTPTSVSSSLLENFVGFLRRFRKSRTSIFLSELKVWGEAAQAWFAKGANTSATIYKYYLQHPSILFFFLYSSTQPSFPILHSQHLSEIHRSFTCCCFFFIHPPDTYPSVSSFFLLSITFSTHPSIQFTPSIHFIYLFMHPSILK